MSAKMITLTTFTFISTNIIFQLGGYDKLISILVTFVVIDYITGIAKAIKKRNLNSYIGFKGMIKKVCIFLVIVVACKLDMLLVNDPIFRTLAIMFYIGNEGISIMENLSELDVLIPDQIRKRLLTIAKEEEKKEKENKDKNEK